VRGEYSYDVEFNASTKMLHFHKLFHLLKHSSLLNLVNLKPMCNNLTFTLILILYDSFVCLLHSCFIENHPVWSWKMNPSFLRQFCHTLRAIHGWPIHYPGIHQYRNGEVSSDSVSINATKFTGPHKSSMHQYLINAFSLGSNRCGP
jgi:hypothetical protein